MAIHDEEPIIFQSAGITCRGVLRLPHPSVSRNQTIVLCPGLGGTQDSPVVQRAVKSFSTAGFNTFTFDYRSFGGSDGRMHCMRLCASCVGYRVRPGVHTRRYLGPLPFAHGVATPRPSARRQRQLDRSTSTHPVARRHAPQRAPRCAVTRLAYVAWSSTYLLGNSLRVHSYR